MRKKSRFTLVMMAVLLMFGMVGIQPAKPVQAALASDLFFSEYIEGTSFNKAIEIFNGTGAPVDLSDYQLELYSNGVSTPSFSVVLSGTLVTGDVFVAAHNLAAQVILDQADLINETVVNWNGDDAIALRKISTNSFVDVFGQIGFDPGAYWGTSPVITENRTLLRKVDICAGDPDGSNAFAPAIEWDMYPTDRFEFLGAHSSNCVLNESEALLWLQDNTTLTGTLDALVATFPAVIPAVIVAEDYVIDSRISFDAALPEGTTISVSRDGNLYIDDLELTGTGPFWLTDLIPGATRAAFDAGYGGAVENYVITVTGPGTNPLDFDTDVTIESVILKGTVETVLADITLPVHIDDAIAPVMESVLPEEGALLFGPEDTFVLTVDAADDNLYELEIDHSLESDPNLPEFSVYASATDPYGGDGALFAAAGVTVTYDDVEQVWTIDFGPTITDAFIANDGITFYMVLKDLAGNTWGSMSPTTDANTYVYTITLDDAAPVMEAVLPEEGALLFGPEDTFILTVDAFDLNLYELEIDHSLWASLPEFSVYADALNPWGTPEDKAQFDAAGVTVEYDDVEQVWTIDFGDTVTDAFIANGGITFYMVLKDVAGNTWGTMYGTTPDNTYIYTITLDEVAPVMESVLPEEGALLFGPEDTLVLTVDAADDNLYELEIDHSLSASLPEFSVYASEATPWGTPEDKAQFDAAGVTVAYDDVEQVWTIDFGDAVTDAFIANGGITFYMVLTDMVGNQWGTMYGTTPDNTYVYTITLDDVAPVMEDVAPGEGLVTLGLDDTFVLIVDALDPNLYELEIDHSFEGTLPEFSVYASEETPWGTQADKDLFDAAGVTIGYDADLQQWTIDFGEAITDNYFIPNGVTFYMVLIDDAGNTWGSMDPTTGENTYAYTFEVTNTLEPEITSAVIYEYTPIYEYVGEIAFDDPNNIFTATYSPAEFLAGGAMNDLARYLGALYRQAGSTVISIVYEGVTYTWDETGTLKGSNWEDASGKTLVSAMVADYLAAPGDLVITVGDGWHTSDVTFELVVTNTLEEEIASAPLYPYADGYVYVGDSVFDDPSNTYTNTYTPAEFLAEGGMNDLARYLGALYRQDGATVISIVYDGVTYTWDETGLLKGSNWEDASGNTLVSAMVTDYLAAPGDLVITVSDGWHMSDVTFKLLITNTLDYEIESAPSYVYSDYTYIGDYAFVDATNIYTVTYDDVEFNPSAMYDLARYLGALYRQDGSTVISIVYGGETYTWDAEVGLQGSNWVDSLGNTLVSKIVDEFDAGLINPAVGLVLTVSDGVHTESVTFKFVILDTIAPVMVEVLPIEGLVTLAADESFVMNVKASDPNLYELEIDHSFEGTLPEFSVYASEETPWGTQADKDLFDAAGVTIGYDADLQQWTIDFGEAITDNYFIPNGVTFYMVLIDDAGNTWGSMDPTTGENTYAYTFEVTNTLEPEITSAVIYEYTPIYEYVGEIAFDDPNNIFTATYSPAEFLAGGAMNDLARYLGALYRQDGATVISIVYDGVTYTWDETGLLKGSNWEDASGNTLVSAMVTDYLAAPGDLVITVSDGWHTSDVTFRLLTTNTLDDEIESAPGYVYSDYTYVGDYVFVDATNIYTVTYDDVEFNPNAMYDLARYLGALYRQDNSTVISIVYDGVTYTWDETGLLKGSNWEDSSGNTLISAVVAGIGSYDPTVGLVFTVSDGVHVENVTFKFVILDTIAPVVDITAATVDGVAMGGDLETGYILPTTNDPEIDHLLQIEATVDAPLADEYFGLYFVEGESTVTAAELQAYYAARGTPDPYLTYLNNAADGVNPFVYIREAALSLSLVDAAKHDIQSIDVDMTVPDDFPLGTYVVCGMVADEAGNETEVTLILIVEGDRVSPMIESGVAKSASDGDVNLVDGAFTVDQGYVVDTIEITMDEDVLVDLGTIVTMQGYGSYGTITANVDSVITITPYPGYETAALIGSFEFTVPDGSITDLAGNPLETLSVTLVVNNVAPVAVDDAYMTDEDVVLNVPARGLLANDTDFDPAILTAVMVSEPADGTLVLNADGSFSYTPDADFFGTDNFTYKANDGELDSNIATVTITVTDFKDQVIAVDDEYETDEDTTLIIGAPGVLANDIDVDLNIMTAGLVTNVEHGTLTLNGDGSFTYDPDPDFYGTDSFEYQLVTYPAPQSLWTDEATVTITVNPVGDGPVLGLIEDATIPELVEFSFTATATDVDLPAQMLTFSLIGAPDGAAIDAATGVFTWTPTEEQGPGVYTFTVMVCDDTAPIPLCDEQEVTLTVTEVNTAPVAQDLFETTLEDIPVDVTLVATDAEDDALTYAIVDQPAHGTVTLVGTTATYTPELDFNGVDSFTYKANDGLEDSAMAVVTITVTPVNDAPVAVDDQYVTDEDVMLTVAAPGILENDSDVEGDEMTIIPVDDVSNGTLEWTLNGGFIYTPDAKFNGTDTFSYMLFDGDAYSNTAVVTITVNPVNDWPLANDDFYEVMTGTDLVKDAAEGILANDVLLDPDEEVSIQILDEPQHGTLSMNDDGSFTYTPDAGYMGRDTFRYLVLSVRTINAEWSDDATVTITVQPYMRLFLPIILR